MTLDWDLQTVQGVSYGSYYQGRLAEVRWGNPDTAVCSQGEFAEQYIWNQAGVPRYKRLLMIKKDTLGRNVEGNLDAAWDYDAEGQMVREYYPNYGATAGPSYSYDRDAMGRLAGMRSWNGSTVIEQVVSPITFNAAGQATDFSYRGYTVAQTYNTLGQMTRMKATSTIGAPNMDLSYTYPATGNNGQIGSYKDNLSGEEVGYEYDSLSRLKKAETTAQSVGQWGLTFGFDGFGNLTSQTPTAKGATVSSSPTIDPATNRLVSTGSVVVTYDANGNLTQFGSDTYTYDIENRLESATVSGSPGTSYGYDSANRRIREGSVFTLWTTSTVRSPLL